MTRVFILRAATTDDAAALIDFGKVLAGERENNILFNSSAEFTFTLEQEIGIIQSYLDTPTAHWLVAVDETGQLIGSINVAPGLGQSRLNNFWFTKVHRGHLCRGAACCALGMAGHAPTKTVVNPSIDRIII